MTARSVNAPSPHPCDRRPSTFTATLLSQPTAVTKPTEPRLSFRAIQKPIFLASPPPPTHRRQLDIDQHRQPASPRQTSMNASIKSISPCILPISPPGAMHTRSRLCKLSHLQQPSAPLQPCRFTQRRTCPLPFWSGAHIPQARISTDGSFFCAQRRFFSFPPPKSSRAPATANPAVYMRIWHAPMSSWEAMSCGCRTAQLRRRMSAEERPAGNRNSSRRSTGAPSLSRTTSYTPIKVRGALPGADGGGC